VNRSSRTDWTFNGAWPYAPSWFDTPDGRMHYVDVGPRGAPPVILVHGNPTWGFLYRNFIPPLVGAGYRVVVPDHLGFGRSDKPDDPSVYSLIRHMHRLEALLESLDLHEATVVPQDWGGPFSLYWAVAHPERVRSLFILNTYAHRPTREVPIPLPLRMFRTPLLGDVLVKGLHLFVRGFLFRAGVVHRERLTPDIRKAYLAPHPTWSSRTGILTLPRQIPTGPRDPATDLTAEIERGLEEHFRSKPVAIAWGMRDPAFTPWWLDELWLKTFPNARVLRLADAGHYVQEDAHEQIVPDLLRFLNPSPAGSRSR
jgi:pimeloyl-ACP methyl ester carboxylesterase